MSNSSKNIVIIGSGMMGSAMARPATDNGHSVRLVGTPLDKDIIASVKENGYHPTLKTTMPQAVSAFYFEELEQALEGCDFIICGVSSFGVDWFTAEALPKLPANMTVLSITKGLELGDAGKLTTFPHKWAAVRPDMRFVAVGGPCISFELMAARHTLVYFVSDSMEAAQDAVALLKTPYYHTLPSTDVIGVETCVALKNAYAMGVSLAVGMAEQEKGICGTEGIVGAATTGAPDANPVYNPQAALFAQSCLEIRRIVAMLGGEDDKAGGIPGAGDLYVTVFGGRTRRLGTLLGRGMSYPEVKQVLNGVTLEAVAIITRMAEALRQRAAKNEIDLAQFPFILHLDDILNKNAKVNPPWECFG